MKGEYPQTRRKAQQLGSSTLAVTVPAEWAHHHDITKGDQLILQRDENSSSLLVTPEEPALTETKTTIAAETMSADALSRAVVTQYILGRGFIRIEAGDTLSSAQYDAVLDAQRRLMGLGIVEESATHITIRCSVDPGDFDLPTLFGRLGRTEATIRSSAVEALLAADSDAAQQVRDRSLQIEKLFSLFLRLVFTTYRNPQLNQMVGVGSGFPLIGYRSAAQDIALMAGIADRIAVIAAEDLVEPLPTRVANGVESVHDALGAAAESVREAVVDPEYSRVISAHERLHTFRECSEAAIEQLEDDRPDPLLALHRCHILFERSARHTEDTLDVATHLAFRESPDVVTQSNP